MVPTSISPVSGDMRLAIRFSSVVLPLPFGPTIPSRSLRRDRQVEVADERLASVGLANLLQLDHALAKPPRQRGELQLAARRLGRSRLHGVDAADPRLLLGAPRAHAAPQPGQLLLEDRLPARLIAHQLGRSRGLELEELAVVAGVGVQRAIVDLDDPADHAFEEVAVVRHQQQRGGRARQEGLEPGDGRDIDMVGRLVEDQQIGRGD